MTAASRPRGTAAFDRTLPPPVGAPPVLTLPSALDRTLENGLRVILVERHALPLVSLQLTFPGGGWAHPPEHAGLAALTADMVDEGTPTRSALDISDALDLLGASFGTTAGYDASTLRLSVLRPRLEAAMELLADMVRSPVVPEQDLDRVRRQRLGRILQRATQPAALADDAFVRAVYGSRHPYGTPLLGREPTLKALDRDRVVAFHGDRYVPEGATLVVVGDVTRADLDTLLEVSFGSWSGSPAAEAGAADVATAAPRVVVAHRPGSAQSEIRIGRAALARSTPDYFAAQVANTILGGSFTSRLNSNLREEKGYTYGAGSYFSMRKRPGPFEASTAVATDVTAEAVGEMLREMRVLGDERVPDPELDRARQYLARRLPQHFESIDDVVSRLAGLALHGMSLDFYDDYVDRVLAVEADDVARVARQEMDPQQMVVVVVGDRAAVEGPLDSLGLGPLEILTSGDER